MTYQKVKTDYKTAILAKSSTTAKITRWAGLKPWHWGLYLAVGITVLVTIGQTIRNDSPQIKQSKQPSELDILPLNSLAIANADPPLLRHSAAEWHTHKVQSGDNLTFFFKRIGLSAHYLPHLLASGPHAKRLQNLMPGQMIQIHLDATGELIALRQHLNHTQVLHIERQSPNRFTSQLIELPAETRINFGMATIEGSLAAAAKKAQLSAKVMAELADIFAYDIDFALDLRPRDRFKVLYEEIFVDGSKVGTGPILAAEFRTQGKVYQAIRFTDTQGNSNYYTPQGKSLKKAFIRTPVNYTRISSHFNLTRKHPVLHKIRAHKGVDYAAPHGTPVKAAGDGKVIFTGTKGGYGNTIILQHGTQYSTLYAHLARFSPQSCQGCNIKQGEIIGYVGKSGLATGNHLHFEFRVNGEHRDPLTVTLPNAQGILPNLRSQYFVHASAMLNLLEHRENVMLAAQ